MEANTEKFISLTDGDVQTFLEGKKTSVRKEKPKVMHSMALMTGFLEAESENRLLEDLS